jgi:glycosyltransferase involved in cell wall biosynthesis
VDILILNWRCSLNPQAGGAETMTFEIARRLVAQGNHVEWFTAGYPGALAEEDLDGIHVIRSGRQWTVHWAAFQRYRGGLRNRFDAVIDEVNTVPFFTPIWADIPAVMLMFQLAREVWWYESRFPLSAIGYAAEPLYLRCYRHVPVLTISESTERDLRRLGFSGPIHIMPVGVEQIEGPAGTKGVIPTFLYVGRLAPSKRVSHIIRAFAAFRSACGPAQLWLVGDGAADYVRTLHSLVEQLGLSRDVQFLGRLPALQKQQRMAEAHVLLMASVREGWGLVVSEANACGTPAIVYDVPGLRDAVRPERTGLVVNPSPAQLAAGMIRLWKDPALYSRLAGEALRRSRSFSFDRAAQVVNRAIADRLAA